MRIIIIALIATATFATTMFISGTDADAVVCRRGFWRAGCVEPHGAVVVRRRPVVVAPVCRRVWINGVRVRRCV